MTSTVEINEPETCPWCDYDVSGFYSRQWLKTRKDGRVQVVCEDCGARGPLAADEHAAIVEWNRIIL